MADEDEQEPTIAEDIVVTKYKMAADITNNVLNECIKKCTPGIKLLEICEFGDIRISEETEKVFRKEKEMKKGIAFPTCISINNIICHYSPLKSENQDADIKDGDLVKIDLGAYVDGFAAVAAHSFVVGASPSNKVTGRKADVLLAAHTAAEACMRLVKPGNENFKVTDFVTKIAEEFKCKPVEGLQSHVMKRNVYDGEKSIIWNPSEEQRKSVEKCTFEVHEVWVVDVLISTGEAKPKESEIRTTVFKKNETIYQLKMKASRHFYSEVSKKFQAYPFSLRSMEDENKARMGVKECVSHDIVQALPVYQEKEGEYVAQFKYTLLLMPNGQMKISGIPFDTSICQSEYKVQDPEIKEVLSTSVRKTQKKKKKPASADKSGDV